MTISTPNTISDQLLSHEAFVRRLALNLVGDASAAEDVAQDAFVLALERGSPGPVGLRGWLAGTVRRLARHRWRSEARRRWREAAAARPESLPVQEPLEEENRVVRLVLALDEPFRETMILTHHHGLRPAEIARRQHVPAATVRSRLHRAHEKLRVALREEHGGDGRAWVLALAPFTGTDPAGAAASAGSLATNAARGWRFAALPSALLAGGILVVAGMTVRPGSDTTLPGQHSSGISPTPSSSASNGSVDRGAMVLPHRTGGSDPVRAPVALEQPAVADPEHPYWRAVREARSSGERFQLDRVESAADQRLRRTVESASLPAFRVAPEESLTIVVNAIASLAGVPASTTPDAEVAALDAGTVYDLELSRPHSLVSVLDLLVFLTRNEIAWTITRGELLVCARAELDARFVELTSELDERFVEFEHDVADFLLDPRDFFGPEEPLHPIFETPCEVSDLAQLILEIVYSWKPRNDLFLVDTTTADIADARDEGVDLVDVLRRAADAGRFDLVFADNACAPGRLVPSSGVSLAQELQALRTEDERWTVFREFVVLWKGRYIYADLALLLRDLRPLFAVERIAGEQLAGHPVLERWVAEEEDSLPLHVGALDQLFRKYVDPESWDDDPANSLWVIDPGILRLRQSPAVVAEIEGILDRLEEIVRKTSR